MLYKELRLQSRQDSPEAFASSYEGADLRTDERWHLQADQSADGCERATFFAIQESPVGLVALYRDDKFDRATELIQMWILPELRSQGLAQELLAFAVNWASANDYGTIQTEVFPSNQQALRFYEKNGFVRVSGKVSRTDSGVILAWSLR